MLILTNNQVASLLAPDGCVRAVGDAFRQAGRDGTYPGFREHVTATGGAYHVVGGGLVLEGQARAGFKINARMGATLRGLMLLSDARSGEPLALFGTSSFTAARTAAVAVVAARALCDITAARAVVVGAGRVGRATAHALSRTAGEVRLHARDQKVRAGNPPDGVRWATGDIVEEVAASNLIVTTTSATAPLFPHDVVADGSTVIALGADAPGKQELDVGLLARAGVVVDSLRQCAASGELSRAVGAGAMTTADVRAELADVVSGQRAGRVDSQEVVVFDAVGTAIADVAVAAYLVHEARRRGVGNDVSLD